MAAPVLVAVGGWIASGKSSVARRLARALSAELLEADELRAELLRMGRREAVAPGFSPELYAELFRRARDHLASGRPVVLDATFRSRRLRDEARRLARELSLPFRLVECRAGESACRERLRAREAAGEAGWQALLDHFLPLWEPPEEVPAGERVVIDTSGPLPLALDASVLNLDAS
jgi:predicted kinase